MNTSEGPRACGSESSDYLIALRDKGLRDAPVEFVPLKRLVIAYTPRVAGEDAAYALALAESEAELPPILVHRKTMAVIDGVHRVRAAHIRNHDHIAARYFDGDEQDATLLSVAANVAQGRPLSLDDRTAAAERVFASHPQWSDRAVAAVVGLSPTKVAQVRRGTSTGSDPTCRRVGRDGRARPMSAALGRELAGELIRENPGASLRQIAKKAGIAPATVADVRNRLRRGDDPVPARHRSPRPAEPSASSPSPQLPSFIRSLPEPPQPFGQLSREQRCRIPGQRGPLSEPQEAKTPAELSTILHSLRRDPSLRFNEAGRNVLRLLDVSAAVAKDRQKLVADVPPHCKELMSHLADGYAEVWWLLAEDLRQTDEADRARVDREDDRSVRSVG